MPSAAYERAIRASAPVDDLRVAAEIMHPDLTGGPARVINDTADCVIEGATWTALRFDARLADAVTGRLPRAELLIDNVGRPLMDPLARSDGLSGGQVRLVLVLLDGQGGGTVEWESTLDVEAVTADTATVTITLGFGPSLDRPATGLRADIARLPQLFAR